MSIRVLIRHAPARAIALVSSTHALVFRHSPSTSDAVFNGSLPSVAGTTSSGRQSLDLPQGHTPRCIVEFSALEDLDLSDFRNLSPLPVHGTLGLITINNDYFICVVEGATKVAQVRPGESVERIFAVAFYCLNSAEYDGLTAGGADELNPYYTTEQDDALQSYNQAMAMRREGAAALGDEHPCVELKKLLGNGSFYYSTDFDLTNRLQDRATEAASLDIDSLKDSFLWNSYMISPLVKFRSRLAERDRRHLDESRILMWATRGFVNTITIPAASAPLRRQKTGLPATLTLISRLSCKKAGTRFNSRGIDDEGNVANFVESETVYWSPSGLCFSYAQIRGSVPVFWEQAPGLIPGQQKISVTRSAEGTQPAFDKHFSELEHNYGAVHVLNLLSETKPGEAELTNLYRYGCRKYLEHQRTQKAAHALLKETEFDFHAETKGPQGYEAASMIRRLIQDSAEGFAYYLAEEAEEDEKTGQSRPVVLLEQEGVFRTNCLDCLDRTNLIQTIISQMAIEAFLHQRGETGSPDFWIRHSALWADNGDALSRIYAGTGALKSSFTRHGKMSFAGAIADARKSATRLYINNFADKGRQNTMDILLGRLVGMTPVHLYDPINDWVNAELNKRSDQFSTTSTINIWVGTFNLNGRTEGTTADLSAWLCPDLEQSQQQPEIVVVGFQEIVELSPQQIMNSDPTRKQLWESAVKKTLNDHAREVGSDPYVLLRSGQLVGAALCIFVKTSVLRNIKNVEGSVKKTGMSGMAGNKGAVAIRMDYCNTSLCFVTAHLAAGFANYEDRNRDYQTIQQGLRFQRNRGIDDHDGIIFLGDFNYRIGLSSERARALIKMGDLETLYENDQLNLQMVAGLAFPFYSESRITFMPTYKYDLGTDTYDTSEKARIPAWTDRILRKGSPLRQINYNTAPLKFSDHRPVYATFLCTVNTVDEDVRESLSRKLYERRRAEVANVASSAPGGDTDDEDLIGYDSIEPGLPPASSDRRKWWLDNGAPARSTLQPTQKGAVPNPKRPSNPFGLSDEPDWVTVPRPNGGVLPNHGLAGSRTNSGNGTIPTMSRNVSQRKLPPPYDPSQNLVNLPSNFSRISMKEGGISQAPPVQPTASSPVAPKLPSRRPSNSSSIVSQNSSTVRKPAPPVAKKPVHLSSATNSPVMNHSTAFGQGSRPSSAISASSFALQAPMMPLRRAATDLSPPPPPQPRRGASRKAVGGAQDDSGGIEAQPKLPPRPSAPADLLSGEEDTDGHLMRGWEVLRPS